MLTKKAFLNLSPTVAELKEAVSDKQKEIQALDVLLTCSDVDQSIGQVSNIPDAPILKALIEHKKQEIAAYDVLLSLEEGGSEKESSDLSLEEKNSAYGSEIEKALLAPINYYKENRHKFREYSKEHLDDLVAKASGFLNGLKNQISGSGATIGADLRKTMLHLPTGAKNARDALAWVTNIINSQAHTDQFTNKVIKPQDKGDGTLDHRALQVSEKKIVELSNIIDVVKNFGAYVKEHGYSGAVGEIDQAAIGSLTDKLGQIYHELASLAKSQG